MKLTSTGAGKMCGRAAGIAIALAFCNVPAFAQTAPSACVTALQQEYGSSTALNAECTNATDCTFQAPLGNASALALIGAMTKKVEACFVAAGLSVVKEDTMPEGATRQYGQPGASEICAVLIAAGPGGLASGLRATCQPAK